MKWWAIYTNFPVDTALRPPTPWSRDSQNKEAFLAPSAGKESRNCRIELSTHHPSLSILRLKGLSFSKMK